MRQAQPLARHEGVEEMLCLIPALYSETVTAVGAVVTVEKPSMFFARLFQTACGNHQENIAEGALLIFIDAADSTGLPFLSFLVLFSFFEPPLRVCGKNTASGSRINDDRR